MLATTHTHATYVLLDPITQFMKAHPRMRIKVRQGRPEQIAELVGEGKAAIGIVHQPNKMPRDVVAVPFVSSPQTLVAPVGHPLLKAKDLNLKMLAEYPFVMQDPVFPQGANILAKFEQAGLTMDVIVQALDVDVVKTYVGAGLGLGVIPAFSYIPLRDRGLRGRDVSHLFDPAVSCVLLRRQGHLPRYAYEFLERLDPSLDRYGLESIVFEREKTIPLVDKIPPPTERIAAAA